MFTLTDIVLLGIKCIDDDAFKELTWLSNKNIANFAKCLDDSLLERLASFIKNLPA